jgi:hypothetical protein
VTQVVDPAVQLAERLADALGAHDVAPAVRARIQQAYIAAGPNEAGWDDLPADIQGLVLQVEDLPRTAWDDPSDVPDDRDDDW